MTYNVLSGTLSLYTNTRSLLSFGRTIALVLTTVVLLTFCEDFR